MPKGENLKKEINPFKNNMLYNFYSMVFADLLGVLGKNFTKPSIYCFSLYL
jgi:hypothetical protein